MKKIITSLRINEDLHQKLMQNAEKIGISFNSYVLLVLNKAMNLNDERGDIAKSVFPK